jgi:hypothetical protein
MPIKLYLNSHIHILLIVWKSTQLALNWILAISLCEMLSSCENWNMCASAGLDSLLQVDSNSNSRKVTSKTSGRINGTNERERVDLSRFQEIAFHWRNNSMTLTVIQISEIFKISAQCFLTCVSLGHTTHKSQKNHRS